MSSWRDIAEDADDKRKRGESTGPLPKQTVIPKRRIEGQSTSTMRPGSAMEGIDDIAAAGQTMVLPQGSPTQPSLSSRFPALAQAGPVPQSLNSPAAPASILSKHLPPQSAQQMQQQSRAPRGPALGYFNTDSQRPIMQASNAQGQSTPPMSDSISQRSLMVAQEAHLERQQALRLEREQAAQAQAHAQAHQAMQQQAIERQLHMKQETDMLNVHQYEQYSNPAMQPNALANPRSDAPNPVIPRTAPPQQYQPRVRNIVGESTSIGRELKSSPSPAVPRAPMSAPPASQEQYAPPPATQPLPTAPPPRQEPARKSNIMSLLNDEPADRGPPPKRVSDVTSSTLQRSQTPPPQHGLQSSRYGAHPPPTTSQPPSQISQQMPSQLASQHQPSQSQHPYTQPSGYASHQQTQSAGPSRSYTPSNFDSRPAYPPQSLYSQSSRQSLSSQPHRREASLSDHHTGGYSHASAPSQSSMRMQDVSYSATPPPGQQQTRQQATSPLDHAQPSDRDYYSRQSYQMQQQSSGARSPQLGPAYHSQSQQQPSHRQMAFGSASHMQSPTPQYATHHPLHRSRRNSFDGRYAPTAASPPAPHQQGYVPAPQHQVTPLSTQYQPHSSQDRFESSYERDRRLQEERDRRLHDDAYHQRRLDESRR